MIVEKRISFVRLVRLTWPELLCILVVSTLPVGSLIYFDLGQYAINASIPLVIGTAIAIVLGFRTNSAYERWWEARKLWGSIVNQSRNLAIATYQYSRAKPGFKAEVLNWVAAWPHAMRVHLTGDPDDGHIEKLVGKSEADKLDQAIHKPVAIGAKIACS